MRLSQLAQTPTSTLIPERRCPDPGCQYPTAAVRWLEALVPDAASIASGDGSETTEG